MIKIKKLWNDPYSKFIIVFIGIYIAIYFFNIGYIGITAKGGLYVPFLAEHLNYIEWWRTFSIEVSAKILRALGETVLTNGTQLKVISKSGFRLVYECLGYGFMSAFIAFCISFPNPFKFRFPFMLAGLVLIQALNIARFVLLALFWHKHKLPFDMDHHTFFNALMYLMMLAICYLWIQYSSKPAHAKNSTP